MRTKLNKILAAYAVVLALILAYYAGRLPYKPESYIQDRVVKIISPGMHGECSGEQVRAPSGESYILTASHCLPIASALDAVVELESGEQIKRKIILEDPKSDLLLLEGVPGLRGLPIAASAERSQEVRAYTHGFNMATYRTEGQLIDHKEVNFVYKIITSEEEEARCASMPKYKVLDAIFVKGCIFSRTETAMTAKVVPGSSGGMVVNSQGDVLGVVSASDGEFGYIVNLDDIQAFLAGY